MTLAPDNFLTGIVPPCLGVRSLDGLAVDHRRRGRGLAPHPLAVAHQAQVVDGLEQEAAHQLAKPPINRLPGPEMDRQHLPPASRADQIAHRIDHLAQIHLTGPATPRRLGHQRCDPLPFLIRQVRRVALGFPGNLGHPATALLCPHPMLEAQTRSAGNPSGQISKRPLRCRTERLICPTARLERDASQPGQCD